MYWHHKSRARVSVMATYKTGAAPLAFHFLFVLWLNFLVNGISFPLIGVETGAGAGAEAPSLTLINKCHYTVTGTRRPVFQILHGESVTLESPAGCSRTLCTFDDHGNHNCATGTCGMISLLCNGDLYDVDGYNLPILVVEANGSACTGCVEFQVDSGVGCKSSGPFTTPNTCKSSSYSQLLNKFCPTAYSSYALDDACSTFACTSITIMLFLWLQRTADQSRLRLVFYMLLVLITLASAARPTLNSHNTKFIDATMHNSDSCPHCHRLSPAPASPDSSHRNCEGNSPACSPH